MASGLPVTEAVCCAGSVFLWRQHVHSVGQQAAARAVLRASDPWVASCLVLLGPRFLELSVPVKLCKPSLPLTLPLAALPETVTPYRALFHPGKGVLRPPPLGARIPHPKGEG